MEVLVWVTAYNHEKYIEQCIRSIATQECSFDFKVAVYDDVSTDQTRDILNDLYCIYSDRMILVYPDQNMFSQGNYIYQWKRILDMEKAKYIAFCEGDDYWNDSNKLQMQYDIMEKNYQCSLCVHRVELYDEMKMEKVKTIPNFKWMGIQEGRNSSMYLITKQLEYGNIFSANSYFLRSEFFYNENFNNSYWNIGLGDFVIFMFQAIHGDVFVLESCMATKRINNIGALSYQAHYNQNYDISKCVDNLKAEILMFSEYNKMTHGKYKIYIENAIIYREIRLKYLLRGLEKESGTVSQYTGQLIKNKIQRKIDHIYIKCIKYIYSGNPAKFALVINRKLKRAYKLC